ncbi:trypsin-like peptidase domain-containing protein [Haloechinothrix sp. LS1_15]|uniref:S1C family serine protease n=1 Tax=Haloechinothrix sp. LS1_15 TaxID=2652248 RepID=UPI00294530F8|nr:trypsin-like peptidase domain-containing protein [Haloechinothrix sp. LS1_15]MDV6014299.1 PDZ domain-containing protein [Haloechinothrix sp. LS1_15]
MNENDRDARGGEEGREQAWPYGESTDTPGRTGSSAGAGPPNPWSRQAYEAREAEQQHVPFGYGYQAYGGVQPMPAAQGQGAYGMPGGYYPSAAGGGDQRRYSRALLVVVTALALVAGGAAGAVGGIVTAGGDGVTGGTSSLNQPPPAERTGDAPEGSVEAVAQEVSPSVVQLQVAGGGRAGEGSGFVISDDGYIMTNSHVVAPGGDEARIRVHFHDGSQATATLVGHDPTTDIAVIRARGVGNLTPVELGRSDDLNVGQDVVAIGSPFALSGTVTSGIISALDRPVRAGGAEGDQETVMNAIQTDAAINPGNSGGPLADMSGRVIGINSAIYSPGQAFGGTQGNVGIGFAIPIDQARRIAEEIIDTGQATQTFIGAMVSNARDGGATIEEVMPDSPAEEAGLNEGDVITRIDDRPVADADALVAEIRTRAPGDTVSMTVGDDTTIEVTLGGQPAEGE